jgi:arginine:pyruvate transaminase
VTVLKPQAGMFVMADVAGLGAFGAAARGWVRISFTLDEARLAEACDRIVGFAKARAG